MNARILMLVGLAGAVLCAGCASVGNASRENTELKARVAALETELADLKAENQKLTPVAVVTIDGLKLEPPTIGELRFTPTPVLGGRSDRWGAVATSTHLVLAGSNEVGFLTAGGTSTIGRGTVTVRKLAAPQNPAGELLLDDRNGASEMIKGTIQLKNSASTTSATTTTTTTTTPASRP